MRTSFRPNRPCGIRAPAKHASLFEFPCACPEPVLVKGSLLVRIKWRKRDAFCAPILAMFSSEVCSAWKPLSITPGAIVFVLMPSFAYVYRRKEESHRPGSTSA